MTADQTLKLLESLLTADDNLLIWKGHKDSGPYADLFYVWSTKLGGGRSQGKPTLGAALFVFRENNAEALKAKSKPFTHSSSKPEDRPANFCQSNTPSERVGTLDGYNRGYVPNMTATTAVPTVDINP